MRITAQLIDALTGTHLWADRFDGSLEDVFELQDRVAISVVGVIEPTLRVAEVGRSRELTTKDPTAYDLYLRALPYAFPPGRDRIGQVFDLLGRAIKRDPHYGPALALAARCHYEMDINGWTDKREDNRRQGIELARQALREAADDPEVLGYAAFTLGYFGEDIDAAVALVDRALTLNPSFSTGWYWSGVLRNWFGRPDLALEHFANYLRLSPRDRLPFYLSAIGISLFFSRKFEDATAKLVESVERLPPHIPTYRFLAASYAHMGRLDEAREIVERLRAITPVVVPSEMPYRNPEHRELLLSGMRLAMGEEA